MEYIEAITNSWNVNHFLGVPYYKMLVNLTLLGNFNQVVEYQVLS